MALFCPVFLTDTKYFYWNGKEFLLLRRLAGQTHFHAGKIQDKVDIPPSLLPVTFYFIFKKQERVIYAHLMCSFQVIQISSFLLCGCLLFLALIFPFCH